MERDNDDDSTDEIVITPEMSEAGCRVIGGYNPKFDLEEDIVATIYREMVKAKYQGVVDAPMFDWCVPQLEAALKFVEMLERNDLWGKRSHPKPRVSR